MLKSINDGMHLDIHGLSWLKLGMVIDITRLHILIHRVSYLYLDSRSQEIRKAKKKGENLNSVILAWSSFKVTFVWSIHNFYIHFLANFSIDLNEILFAATTCEFIEAYTKFILHI